MGTEYKDEYPSRFPKGTLGWVLDQETGVEEVTKVRKEEIKSEFDKLEAAYKAGRKAGAAGLGRNTCPCVDEQERCEWIRGWVDVTRTARQAALLRT
jgi:ribosome modulation factor